MKKKTNKLKPTTKNDKNKINGTRSTKQLVPIITGLSFVCVSGVLVATSVGLSSQAINPLKNTSQLLFDNKTFKSKDELMEYAQKNYFQRMENVENRISWSIDERGQKIYFNDPKLLRESLFSNIKQMSALSSKNFSLSNGGLGEISGNDFSSLYFNKTQEELKTNIYRGKNNSIHQTEKLAKDSYLSMHDAYYFNNIYFRNIEELKLYLQTVYYVKGGDGEFKKTIPENIAVVGVDGISSSPINSLDLFFDETPTTTASQKDKTLQSKKDFMNNVSSQVKKYVQIKDEDNRYFYANEKDLKNPSADLLLKFNNPSYTTLHSNQGIGSYVIDLDEADENTLFGAYYAKTPGDFINMKDSDQWKKAEKNDPLISQEANSNLLSGLMNLVLVEDDELTASQINKMPINIKYLNDSLILPYYELLKEKNNRVYESWLEFSATIKKGKRYNTFNSLPIFFIFLIENLVENEGSEFIINKTKVFFNEIARYLDQVVQILLPREMLKINRPNGKYGEYLSFEEIFDFYNNDLDLSVNLEYFINEISSNFSQFIVTINIISQASLNAMYSGGVLSYNHEHIKRVLRANSNIIREENIPIYEKIWNMFSSTSANEFQAILTSKNIGKTIDNEFLGDLVISIVLTNSLFSSSEKFIFDKFFKEIKYSPGDRNTIIITNDVYNILSEVSNSTAKRLINAQSVLTWENFMLIKFIDKIDSKLLIDTAFDSNQDDLKKTLQGISKQKITSEQYSKNFIINNKVSENLSNVSKKSLNGGIDLSKDFLGFISKISSQLDKNNTIKIEKITKELLTTFEKVGAFNPESMKNLMKALKFSKVLSSIASSVVYVQAALIVLELAMDMFVPVTKYNSYIFENSHGNKYIWNGGQTTTMFFGLVELSSTTIKDMQLLEPQRISRGRIKDEYYFNGKRYSGRSDDKLKIDQLRAIINNEYQTENVKIVYSFDAISTIGNNTLANPSDKVFETFGIIDDLFKTSVPPQSLVQYLYNAIFNSLNQTNKLYHVDKFIFANGHVATSSSDVMDELINEVVNNIQPIKIALLPHIINNKPKYNDHSGNDEDYSMPEYILPSISWNYTGYSVNKTNNNYIIFDSNQLNKFISNSDAELYVKELFYAAFDIESKVVIENEIKNNNAFTSMSSSILDNVIFEVRLENNEVKYFFDQMSAFNWLLSKSNFTLYSYNTSADIYKFEDKVFYSREEFINFIFNNAVVVMEGE